MVVSLSQFIGLWTISRQIQQADGSKAQFLGEAHWSVTSDGARQVETGLLTLEGQGSFQAERTYLWREQDSGLCVYFEDGRFFHALPFEGASGARHWCDPDTYHVTYDFAQFPATFETVWRVTGPRKDYTMHTHFRRA